MMPLEWKDQALEIIDQRMLPTEQVRRRLETIDQLIEAIGTLQVRGAPALGIAGAYGVALILQQALSMPESEQSSYVDRQLDRLRHIRPTAVNLAREVDGLCTLLQYPLTLELVNRVTAAATRLMSGDQEQGRSMGRLGAELIETGHSYLTHCNTGGLATSGVGTALNVFVEAARQGRVPHVYADETRPLLQGSRLTMLELQEAGIPATLITDSMAASLLQSGIISGVFVGADRIAANGDTANKIGTLNLAVLGAHFGRPFYVVAPESTIDPTLSDGGGINIEQRPLDEVRFIQGVQIAPTGCNAYNPAFDVTPGTLITGIITEKKIYRQPYNFRRS